jgi:hypothetical protein
MLLITGIKSPQIFGMDSQMIEPLQNGSFSKQKVGLSDEIFNIGEIAFD